MQVRKIYRFGQGGKHRDDTDARTWRELTAHIAANFRAQFPLSGSGALSYAEDLAGEARARMNRRAVDNTLGA